MADIRDEINLSDEIELHIENESKNPIQVEQVKNGQVEEKKQLQEVQVEEKVQEAKIQVQKEQEQSSNGQNLPIKQGFWERIKVFWFEKINWNKEIKIELTPHQQKIENEINEFLHQEVTWKKIHDFLFKKRAFGKKKAEI